MLNFGWLVVERFARLLCNVVVGFAVARYLGPAQFGTLSYAFALIAIGAAVAESGAANIVKREIAADPARAAGALAAAWRLRLLLGLVCYAALWLWTVAGREDASTRLLLLIGGLTLFQPALALSDLWLQARLRAGRATLAQIGALAVTAALRLGLVGLRAPLWTFAAATVVETALAILLLNRAARAQGQPAITGIEWAAVRRLWANSWPLMLSGLMVMLYLRLDVVMLRRMAGESSAGNYAAAIRLSELWFFVPGAIAGSLLPQILRCRAEGAAAYRSAVQRLMDLSVVAGYALALPTVLLAPWLIRIAYGPAFASGATVLAVHGWTLIWVAIGVARGQYCVNEGLIRLHLASTTAGAALNLGLNLLLIPRYGPVGAAWATLAAQVVAAWLSSYWFAPLRACARMQTRALLLPLRWLLHAKRPA